MSKKDIMSYVRHPSKLIVFLGTRGFMRWMPDETYLKIAYKACIGRKLDLDYPKAYTEKLQWLKLYCRKKEFTMMADKAEVKSFVAKKIGDEHVIPTYGVWNRFDDIDFDGLPDQFVLKCTHDSGSVVICKDKSKLDIPSAREKLEYGLKKRPYDNVREWVYKDIKPRIIAEKYMQSQNAESLNDYKLFCFDGQVKMLFVAANRNVSGKELTFDFYDDNFQHLPFINGHPNDNTNSIIHPSQFEKMKEYARILSQGIPHVRVDFYEINGEVYFGEMTFYHFGGIVPFEPDEWDYRIGEWLKLPSKTN